MLAPRYIAQTLGKGNAFEINGLCACDGRVTDDMRVCAFGGAVVEYGGRAGAGFADD